MIERSLLTCVGEALKIGQRAKGPLVDDLCWKDPISGFTTGETATSVLFVQLPTSVGKAGPWQDAARQSPFSTPKGLGNRLRPVADVQLQEKPPEAESNPKVHFVLLAGSPHGGFTHASRFRGRI